MVELISWMHVMVAKNIKWVDKKTGCAKEECIKRKAESISWSC